MEPIQQILKDYTEADEERRLSIYLTHRDLRRLFNKVEMTALAQPQQMPSTQTQASREGHQSGRLAGICLGWLRHCCMPR